MLMILLTDLIIVDFFTLYTLNKKEVSKQLTPHYILIVLLYSFSLKQFKSLNLLVRLWKFEVAKEFVWLFDGKVFWIGTVRYNWPMSAHASQAFSIAHCTDSEDLPFDAA